MGVVLRNNTDMPVPDFAYTDRHDGRVFVIDVGIDGKAHKHTIGQMTDSHSEPKRMVPNAYFRDHYQDLYMDAYPNEKIPPHELGIGMYCLTLGISEEIQLYSDLQAVYGPVRANSILDYAIYSIMYRSDVTQLYPEAMADKVLFADKLYSDSWYSSFFKGMTEDEHHQFRIRRINYLIRQGLKSVWIAVDGSNDCEARKSYLATYGFPKSHNANKTIVGYMYAVDAETGRPITYFAYEGSVPDCQAFQKIATFLGDFDLQIEGVILDRGFAVEEVFQTISELEWKYVIMLPSDTYGHKQMLEKHGEEIRWKSRFLVDEDGLFGISDLQKLFGSHERMSNICLFFDGVGGSHQSARLIKKILAAKKKAESAIANGKRAGIEKNLCKYLCITGEGSNRGVVVNYDAWDDSMADKGFYSIAASEGINAEEANRLYKTRDTSETQFSILKSQEGYDTTRVHRTEGILSKFFMVFVCSIIRFEIEDSCKRLGLDTNPTIQSLNRIALLYTPSNEYKSIRNLTIPQKELFSLHNIDQDTFEYHARAYNKRRQTDAKNPNRSLANTDVPIMRKNSGKPGRKATNSAPDNSISSTEGNVPEQLKSKGGRPKGKKDSKPRKPRSDKGKVRGRRPKKEIN